MYFRNGKFLETHLHGLSDSLTQNVFHNWILTLLGASFDNIESGKHEPSSINMLQALSSLVIRRDLNPLNAKYLLLLRQNLLRH